MRLAASRPFRQQDLVFPAAGRVWVPDMYAALHNFFSSERGDKRGSAALARPFGAGRLGHVVWSKQRS